MSVAPVSTSYFAKEPSKNTAHASERQRDREQYSFRHLINETLQPPEENHSEENAPIALDKRKIFHLSSYRVLFGIAICALAAFVVYQVYLSTQMCQTDVTVRTCKTTTRTVFESCSNFPHNFFGLLENSPINSLHYSCSCRTMCKETPCSCTTICREQRDYSRSPAKEVFSALQEHDSAST